MPEVWNDLFLSSDYERDVQIGEAFRVSAGYRHDAMLSHIHSATIDTDALNKVILSHDNSVSLAPGDQVRIGSPTVGTFTDVLVVTKISNLFTSHDQALFVDVIDLNNIVEVPEFSGSGTLTEPGGVAMYKLHSANHVVSYTLPQHIRGMSAVKLVAATFINRRSYGLYSGHLEDLSKEDNIVIDLDQIGGCYQSNNPVLQNKFAIVNAGNVGQSQFGSVTIHVEDLVNGLYCTTFSKRNVPRITLKLLDGDGVTPAKIGRYHIWLKYLAERGA